MVTLYNILSMQIPAICLYKYFKMDKGATMPSFYRRLATYTYHLQQIPMGNLTKEVLQQVLGFNPYDYRQSCEVRMGLLL
jgi:hypothetical protein